MKHMLLTALAISLATTAASTEAAQNVYRCGPDGRELSQKPCAEGERVELKAGNPSAADRAAAQDVAKRDAELAQRMQRDREQLQAERVRQLGKPGAIHAGGAPAASQAASSPKKRHAKDSKKKDAAKASRGTTAR